MVSIFKFFENRIEDVVKRLHKTINTIYLLQKDIISLFYDIKELATAYQGNLITLCVGIAVAVFNYNRPNAGMFFHFFEKRSTVDYIIQTQNVTDESKVNTTTFTISETNSSSQGIFSKICVCRWNEIF